MRRAPLSEGWAWVQGLLMALRDGARPGAAVRGADRQLLALEKDEAFGARPRKVMVHYPGLGESFEMTLLPEYMKGRRRPSVASKKASTASAREDGRPRPYVFAGQGARGRAMPRRS